MHAYRNLKDFSSESMVVGWHRKLEAAEGSLYGPHAPFCSLLSRNQLFIEDLQSSKLDWILWKPITLLHWGHNPIIKSIGTLGERSVTYDLKSRWGLIQQCVVKSLCHIGIVPRARCIQDFVDDCSIWGKCEDTTAVMSTRPFIIISILQSNTRRKSVYCMIHLA
jgi:hypothetical protein